MSDIFKVNKPCKSTGVTKSKRGSVMVEATMIYPIIVFSAVMLLYMTVSLFQIVCIVTGMNTALSSAAGEVTSTVCYDGEFQRDSLYIKPGRKETEASITEAFNKRIESMPIKIGSENCTAGFKNGLLFNEISIQVDKTISATGVLSYFNRKTYQESLSIVDEAEWIRSNDLLIGEKDS